SEGFRRGRVRMQVLRLAGRPVAQLCDLVTGGGAFAFKAAYDEAHAACSPGALLDVECVRDTHARGLRWVDSCKSVGESHLDRIWSGRRPIQDLMFAAGHDSLALLVSLLPLFRWLKRRADIASQALCGRRPATTFPRLRAPQASRS